MTNDNSHAGRITALERQMDELLKIVDDYSRITAKAVDNMELMQKTLELHQEMFKLKQ